jgi:hypothetical protein
MVSKPVCCKVSVTWSDKYNPAMGHIALDHLSPQFTQMLQSFESGEITMKDAAFDVIFFLFDRDFKRSAINEGGWKDDGGCAKLIKRHPSGAESYRCQYTNVWNDRNVFVEAKSESVVTLSFDRKRVRIDDYSYYLAR